VWDLTELNNESFSHFEVNGGTFECNNMIINSFNNSNLKFFEAKSNNMTISINKLLYEGITTSLSNTHFTLVGGESNLTDTVFFFFYFLILFYFINFILFNFLFS
jgi:hypothetical protein